MNIEKFCISIHIRNASSAIGLKAVLTWSRVFEVHTGCPRSPAAPGSPVSPGIPCRKNISEITCFVSLSRNYTNRKGYVITCIFFSGWRLPGFQVFLCLPGLRALLGVPRNRATNIVEIPLLQIPSTLNNNFIEGFCDVILEVIFDYCNIDWVFNNIRSFCLYDIYIQVRHTCGPITPICPGEPGIPGSPYLKTLR